jgi:hypothetical protein
MDWKKIGSAALSNNIVLLVFIGLAAIAYLRFAPDSLKPWTNVPQPAVQPKDPVATIERIYIPGPERVRVIETIKYLEKVPGAVTPQTAADNTAHVIASAKIPPSSAGGTATGILQYGPDGVGTGRIEWKPAEPPFFAVQKEFGVRAGMGTGGLVLGEIYARPLRLGSATVEVRGFGKRDDRSGADFGGAVLGDMRF